MSLCYVGLPSSSDEDWSYVSWSKTVSERTWGPYVRYQEVQGWIPTHYLTRERVTVVSFGLQTLKLPVEGPVSDADLRHALTQHGYHRAVDFFIDCRGFNNPHHSTEHPGMHPDVLADLAANDIFPEFISDVRNTWQEILNRRRQRADVSSAGFLDITVATFCKYGKHRSVGIQEHLLCILTQLGFLVDTEYLSFRYWSKAKCRGTCSLCKGIHHRKLDALHVSAKEWGCLSKSGVPLQTFLQRRYGG